MKKIKKTDLGYALITGASSGMGCEFARLLAADGWNLILVARNMSNLENISRSLKSDFNIKVKVLCQDLSLPDTARLIFEDLQKENIEVNALINCAGLSVHGEFGASDLHEQMHMIQVNICALTSLTRIFLAPMLERKSGWILNVASTAAFRSAPLQAVYYASKAYVLHFTEALSNELKDSGVTATCFCPGATKTDFFRRAGMKVPQSLQNQLMNADRAAAIGYQAALKGKVVVIPGIKNKLSVFIMRVLPRSMAIKIMRKVMDTAR